MYKLREERNIKPSTFGQLVSSTLYEKRCCVTHCHHSSAKSLPSNAPVNKLFDYRFGPYFCSPVIAGLEQDGTPYLCGMDTIGAIETAHDFMVAGTAPDSLYGMCESMWKPDLVSWHTETFLNCLHDLP